MISVSNQAAGGHIAPAGDMRLLLLIARRGALESLRDRMTLVMSLFFALAFPTFLVLTAVRPLAGNHPSTVGAGLAGGFDIGWLLSDRMVRSRGDPLIAPPLPRPAPHHGP